VGLSEEVVGSSGVGGAGGSGIGSLVLGRNDVPPVGLVTVLELPGIMAVRSPFKLNAPAKHKNGEIIRPIIARALSAPSTDQITARTQAGSQRSSHDGFSGKIGEVKC
jgi:hypothetical protein